MKILITLRHPGPAQAIIPAIKWLDKYYNQIILIISDEIFSFIRINYRQDISGREVYINIKGFWQKILFDDLDDNHVGDRNFIDGRMGDFKSLINEMEYILNKEEPDMILRTTPAIGQGIDEAVTFAAEHLGILNKLRCFQECYDCGRYLEKLINPVAVVDLIAKEKMQAKGIKCTVVGWLLHGTFCKYKNYRLVRKETRKRLKLKDTDKVYMYCMIASGNFEIEKQHFRLFLNAIGQKKFWILFHPRNTTEEKNNYLSMVRNMNYQLATHMKREEILAFPDFIVSLGSAINIDALQYQIYSGCTTTETVSVYTSGELTSKIFKKIFKEETQPFCEVNRGSIVADETNYYQIMDESIEIDRKSLFSQASMVFGGNYQKIQNNFIEYLKA